MRRDPTPADVAEVVWQSLRYFAHHDEANAAIHTSPVRYSPLTFRLAEVLMRCFAPLDEGPRDETVRRVIADRGLYAEDTGR